MIFFSFNRKSHYTKTKNGDWSLGKQGGYQIAAAFVAFAFAIVGGIITGIICFLKTFNPSNKLFFQTFNPSNKLFFQMLNWPFIFFIKIFSILIYQVLSLYRKNSIFDDYLENCVKIDHRFLTYNHDNSQDRREGVGVKIEKAVRDFFSILGT